MLLIDRISSFKWLPTGYISFTFVANVSFGQRQLIVGNNKVGKTTLLSNILKNIYINKNFSYLETQFLYSFYNFIGSSRREYIFTRKIHKDLCKHFTFFIDGTVSLDIYKQFESPFTCVNICEKLCVNGIDTIHVLDSLSNHAKIYRHLMLDLKRAPGREAYPGDIFYLHAKILEKYGQFNYMHNLGSMTGLPITEVQKNNITDYITTNLISITDGQWFLSSLLSLKSMYPSLDVNLSVSRLGSISHNIFLKFLGVEVNSLIAEYTSLEDLRRSVSLSAEKELIFLRSAKIYSMFFWRQALSYLNLVLAVMYGLMFKNFIFCNDTTNLERNFLGFILKGNFSNIGLLLFWTFHSKNSFNLTLILNYFMTEFVYDSKFY